MVYRIAFQPIWDLVNQEITAYEALMRPRDARTPTEVLKRFRDDNQIVPLDQTLIHQAMSEAQTLLHNRQLLMVNAEPETLNQHEFWESWNFPLSPQQVVVEITERAPLEDLELDVFHRLGVRLALDDFGTGMSNLLALERIRPAFIKMNRDFLVNHDDTGILALMARQCVRMGTQLIVEGVEDEFDVAFLHRIGARYAQGFYLGMPKFAEEYEEGSLSKHVAHWY